MKEWNCWSGKSRRRGRVKGDTSWYGGEDGKLHTKAPRYVRGVKFCDQSPSPSRLQFLSLAIPAVDPTSNCPEEYLPTNLISTPARDLQVDISSHSTQNTSITTRYCYSCSSSLAIEHQSQGFDRAIKYLMLKSSILTALSRASNQDDREGPALDSKIAIAFYFYIATDKPLHMKTDSEKLAR